MNMTVATTNESDTNPSNCGMEANVRAISMDLTQPTGSMTEDNERNRSIAGPSNAITPSEGRFMPEKGKFRLTIEYYYEVEAL